ncbi:HEXXH motif-containing putative peptide modification protein [Actinoplanes sp. L3-i22]|uniref:aKG-HExxH-type peptide beta-hydroxylase n=1 Tax=Actinoplanes sp. L3-i22 TaxID=2836373 RepID=UPI001C760452|nr:HEXXH motif-containing putative peptide modification protein [Actinoplanes sp. L3-i22]BCY13150.1 hypothetical protein L3i22_082380 [Actinoplanes sp. L3-i22]
MTGFTLTTAQFDGLGAGYGTPDALAVLRAVQLTKRKQLLQRIMAMPASAAAIDLLIRAEQRDPAAVEQVLRHPHLDAGLGQALKSGGDLGYLAQVAAAAAVRAGVTFTIEVPVVGGSVHLPTLGAATVTGDRVEVTGAADGTTRIGPVRLGGPGWAATRRVELEPGYSIVVEDQELYRDTYQWRPQPRLDEPAADRFAELLRAAWAILVRRHPEHAAAMRVLLTMVVPLATPPSGDLVSAASRRASGSVAVVIPPEAENLCLLLLHEFMHMKLDALRDLTPLHVKSPVGRHYAPWRMDPRPVPALLQGVYAHTGVTDYWRQRRRDAGAPAIADVEFSYWHRQSGLAADELAGSDELTAQGTRFVGLLRDTLAAWPDPELPGRTVALVAAMVRAQTIRWRSRNWSPADAEVDAVLAAWRSGRALGPVASAGRLRGAARNEPLHLPGIVGVLRDVLTGGQAEDPADHAYLSGDLELAAELYAKRLNDTDDAWVGFALAVSDAAPRRPVLRDRPDLARAVLHRSAREDGADPATVAGWMQGQPVGRSA